MTLVAPGLAVSDLVSVFHELGLRAGDTVLVQASLGAVAADGQGGVGADAALVLLAGLRQAVGVGGTLVVPTYTFSFCRQEIFDVAHTPTVGGPWSRSADFLELARSRSEAVRSCDPIHSVAALGPGAEALVADLPPTCFGAGSVFDRLRRARAKICLVGLPLEEATFRHHVEELVGVPFRFRKLFTGLIRDATGTRRTGWVYSVRILANNGCPDGAHLEAVARREGVCRAVSLGRGEVLAVDCAEFFDLTARELSRDPWFTARGPAGDPVDLDARRVGGRPVAVALPQNASMRQMIDRLWALPRDIVSDGYDTALRALAGQVPMTIHEFPSGLECWSWIVPEKWTCHEAYLETLDGRRLFSYADHPLHVVSYSLPFEGEVPREVLLEHLHVHPTLPEAIPFVFKYYDRDWGLCCARTLRDTLDAPRYRVVIRTAFSFGTLKVGEVVVPGRSEETVVLCAHLCHPGMVNDDLTGVVVGIDVMRALLARPRPRFTYRLLIVPETIGSVAFLSQHPDLVGRMRGGLFLEMLGRDHPHALQLSFAGTSEPDRCFAYALRRGDPAGWTAPFRSLMGNDERQFNAPGVRIPMLALTRQLAPSAPDFPYREYHSSEDTPERVPDGALERSRNLVLQMLDTLERNVIPVNRFAGEVFCSRYGIHIDPDTNPEGNQALFDIMFLIDGTRSVIDIAEACGVSAETVQATLDELARRGLVEYRDAG